MKRIVMVVVSLSVLSAMCMTVQEKGQYKRMSATYTEKPSDFFERKVKTATILVKCHPSDITTGIGSQGTGQQNKPFACSTLEGKDENLFFAYALKSSRVYRELIKFHSEKNPDGEVECYMTVEKLSPDQIWVSGTFKRIDGCWIKEFMSKETYESAAPKKSVAAASKPEISTSSISIAMFKADKTAGPVKYRAKARLSDYYNYDFQHCVETHWSVRLACKDANGNDGSFCGYVAKKGNLGMAVKKLLEDGKEHEVEVVLSHPRKARSSDHCEILSLVANSVSSNTNEIPAATGRVDEGGGGK